MLPHPWRRLRAHGNDWKMRITDELPGGTQGKTIREKREILIAAGMTQAERRSTLAHELEHVAGHNDESRCHRNAARYLMPDVRRVGEALAWAHDLDEAADELWVDRPTLEVRLECLHPCERAYLRRRLADGPGI